MTVVDQTAASQSEIISFELELEHTPEKVWRALTEPELLEQWLLPTIGLKLEPGASFAFETQPHPGWDGTVNCRLVELEPQRKLSYTWVVADGVIDTVVTFTLTPTTSGTRLSLRQTGFKIENEQAFAGQRYGWKLMGNRLVQLLGRMS